MNAVNLTPKNFILLSLLEFFVPMTLTLTQWPWYTNMT